MTITDIATTVSGSCAALLESNLTNATHACLDGLVEVDPLGAGSRGLWDDMTATAFLPFRVVGCAIVAVWCLAMTAALYTWITSLIPTLIWDKKGLKPQRLDQNVWTIHGKKYDLSSWAKDHPGGELMINLGRNRDCTGLFESYHAFIDRAKLFKVLARFEIHSEKEVTGAAEPAQSQAEDNLTGLEFGDPFHEDVKLMVREHFQNGKKSHKMKPWVACVMISLIISEVVLAYMWLQGSAVAMVLLPTVGWLLCCNVAHDGSHFAVSKRPWLNVLASHAGMPFCFPSITWHVQHVVQHHVYTNDEDDVDLYHFLPVVRTSAITKFSNRFKLQWLSVFFVLPTTVGHLMFIVPMDLLSGGLDMITGEKRYSQCRGLEDTVSRYSGRIWAEFAFCLSWWILAIFNFGVLEGSRRAILTYAISSAWFICVTQGAHLQKECMVDHGDKSWAKRQSRTSLNFCCDSTFWLILTGGLNMQSLHHVVPPIGSSHFADMWPAYKKVCEKHGVHVKEAKGPWDFIKGFMRWIAELAEEEK
mmetsp:Transcript_65691/g.140485  ORF Transcript_65691/g.140485 Transcript_65691/m.140485 type:complete len:531 (-) Transcript_65691:343-1935(-)